MSDPVETSESIREGRLDFSKKPSEFVSPGLLAKAIRDGWQVNPERKRKYFAAMDAAIDSLSQIADLKDRANISAQCTRVLVAEQGQAIKDIQHRENMEHEDGILDLRLKRADDGKPESIVQVNIAPAESLPEPDWLSKRRLMLEPSQS